VSVTGPTALRAEIWPDCNQRADTGNRIAELRYTLVADDFCPHDFFATQAALCALLLLFILLGEFQMLSGLKAYRQPKEPVLTSHVRFCGILIVAHGVLRAQNAYKLLESGKALSPW